MEGFDVVKTLTTRGSNGRDRFELVPFSKGNVGDSKTFDGSLGVDICHEACINTGNIINLVFRTKDNHI